MDIIVKRLKYFYTHVGIYNVFDHFNLNPFYEKSPIVEKLFLIRHNYFILKERRWKRN